MILINKQAKHFLNTDSQYFKAHEFACKCGCGEVQVSVELIKKLNSLRTRINTSLIVNSGYRCATHNATVGGTPTSQHLLGTAADIRMHDRDIRDTLVKYAKTLFNGVIVYDWGVHLDVRDTPYFKDHTVPKTLVFKCRYV